MATFGSCAGRDQSLNLHHLAEAGALQAGERAEICHFQCGKGGRNGQGGKGALQAERYRIWSTVGRSVGVPSQTQSKLRPKVAIRKSRL